MHRFERGKIPAKAIRVALQALAFKARQNVLERQAQLGQIDLTGAEQGEHVLKIAFTAALDLAQRRAVQIEVKHINLAKPADEFRAFFPAAWQAG